MESIKHTIDELTQIFKRMNDFQKELKCNTLATSSPSSISISSQFDSFRIWNIYQNSTKIWRYGLGEKFFYCMECWRPIKGRHNGMCDETN
ncbi:unnamed protein product [Euphydryas editha]|uniref:Uncharacterized protein n=1 Tax=Euphydryas editha TaxID=104508 RepID=A0AAU9USE4_EUPED|nr:unnamed protein product [Euphydryas editha]